MVATGAVNATLRWVGKDAGLRGGDTNFFGGLQSWFERGPSGFVADEFDAEEQAEATDIADVRMRGERS